MRKLLQFVRSMSASAVVALVLVLASALVTAQSGQTPAVVTYATTAPTTLSCLPGYFWHDKSTDHLWGCRGTAWVDLTQVAISGSSAGFPITATSGTETISLLGVPASHLAALGANDTATGNNTSFSLNNQTGFQGAQMSVIAGSDFSTFAVAPTEQQALITDGVVTALNLLGLTGFQHYVDNGTNAINSVATLATPNVVTTVTSTTAGNRTVSSILEAANGNTQARFDVIDATNNLQTYAEFLPHQGSIVSQNSATGTLSRFVTTEGGIARGFAQDTAENASLVIDADSAFSRQGTRAALVAGSDTATVAAQYNLATVAANNGALFASVIVEPQGPRINTTGTKPTCDASNRGKMWRTLGGAGVADTFEACLKDAGDAYAWRTLF